MSKRKLTETQTLEQLHRQLFKSHENKHLSGDEESLEQPYVGDIVDSVTTNSAYTDPRFGK